MKSRKIVVIGGGTGIYSTLTGLKRYSQAITAVVTMADDGGSSGRLRDEFGHLPPGDVRRCLLALSPNRRVNSILRDLFEYRFDKGAGLKGHSFGNLLLTALAELTGSMEVAIQEASRLLNVRGMVLPVTTDNVRLCAELENGTLISGEHNIDVRTVAPEVRIKHVFLSPGARIYPPAREAILNADVIVLGPGDLYTSLLPNLSVEGLREAVMASSAQRIYVCNLMTKHGETDGFKASDFLAEVSSYLDGTGSFTDMIVNTEYIPSTVLDKYAREKAFQVVADMDACLKLVPSVYDGPLVTRGGLIRHDPTKLARLIMRSVNDYESSRFSESSSEPVSLAAYRRARNL